MAESTSSVNVPRGPHWSSQRQLSDEVGECEQPAMCCHSPAPSLGHSGVGSTQEAAIQFATLDVASSAFSAVPASPLLRQLQVIFRPVKASDREFVAQQIESVICLLIPQPWILVTRDLRCFSYCNEKQACRPQARRGTVCSDAWAYVKMRFNQTHWDPPWNDASIFFRYCQPTMRQRRWT